MHIQRLQCEPVAGLQGKAEVCEVPKGAQRLIRGSWQVCQPALLHTLHWCSLCFMFMKNCPLTLPIMSKNTFLSFVSLKLKNRLLQRQNENKKIIFIQWQKRVFLYYIDSLKVTEYFLISAFLEIGGIKHLFILRTNSLESWLLQNPQKCIVYNTNFIFKQCVTSLKTTKKYFILNFNLWTGFRRAASHKII